MILNLLKLKSIKNRTFIHTYSLLGFGDILVPGLLLSFAHSYDLLTGIKYKLYWSITTIGEYLINVSAQRVSVLFWFLIEHFLFETIWNHYHFKGLYFKWISFSAYIPGLVATFISLFLMNSAQPALLYLVPFTLVPTILVAWCRGDLPSMWDGDSKVMEIDR